MSNSVRTWITPADMATVFRKAGYRANLVRRHDRPQLQSTAQGFGFFIGFGTALAGGSERYEDFSYHCLIEVQGELPTGIVEDWNRDLRFARMFLQNRLLVLAMDITLAGGVTDEFLTAQVELWDRVMHDFIAHVRRPMASAQPASAGLPT